MCRYLKKDQSDNNTAKYIKQALFGPIHVFRIIVLFQLIRLVKKSKIKVK